MNAVPVPTYDVDLFCDDALAAPYGHYRTLRDLGPVVWLTAHDCFFVGRYQDVRAILADPTRFCSGQGVGLNDFMNKAGRGTTLMSDGDEHRRLRRVIAPPLTPRAVADLRPEAQALADRMVDGLVERRTFDAVGDLAEVLPTTWVPDLLGWPAEGRDKLLDWAGDTFDGFGPLNERTLAAGDGLTEMAAYAERLAHSDLPAGSMAAGILQAAERGEIDQARCPMAIIDYLGPSLDTTISGIGNAIWLLATHPDQWEELREDPGRVRQAFNEALRLESPISCFTRVTTRPAAVDGTELPGGSRVLVSFAAANRDDRHWNDPDAFDVTRESADHVAFGHGEHLCIGMGLARLEAAAVLTALVERVRTIELVDEPQRKLNNVIRSFASLPAEVEPA